MAKKPLALINDEKQALAELGLKNWYELSKDKVIPLLQMIHRMPQQLIDQIGKQIPDFAKAAFTLATEANKGANKTAQEAIKGNSEIAVEGTKLKETAIRGLGKLANHPDSTKEEREKAAERIEKICLSGTEQSNRVIEGNQSLAESSQSSSTASNTLLCCELLAGAAVFLGYKVDPKLVPKLLAKIRK